MFLRELIKRDYSGYVISLARLSSWVSYSGGTDNVLDSYNFFDKTDIVPGLLGLARLFGRVLGETPAGVPAFMIFPSLTIRSWHVLMYANAQM